MKLVLLLNLCFVSLAVHLIFLDSLIISFLFVLYLDLPDGSNGYENTQEMHNHGSSVVPRWFLNYSKAVPLFF